MQWSTAVYGLASLGMLLYAAGAAWDAALAKSPSIMSRLIWRRRRFRDASHSRRFASRAVGLSGLWLACAVVLALMAVEDAYGTGSPPAGIYLTVFLAGLFWCGGWAAWSFRYR